VRLATDAYVRELAAGHCEIDEVILFGSLVSGIPVPGSDVDLLIILNESHRPFLERLPAYLPGRFPVAMDVFPYTRAEIDRMQREGNWLVRAALRDRVSIFRRQDPPGRS
jgi:uncharacterized protein